MMLDAIVIGGGPAGLSAATWLARYRRTVLVLDSREYRNRWADASHGYFTRDPAWSGDSGVKSAGQRGLGWPTLLPPQGHDDPVRGAATGWQPPPVAAQRG